MAHFAKLENNIVVSVIVIDNKHEESGQNYINETLGLQGTWIQTSYNTYGGKHQLGGTPLRVNFAGVGYFYDQELDVFIPPKIHDSWILNEESFLWEPPIERPNDGQNYNWNESIVNWELVETEEE